MMHDPDDLCLVFEDDSAADNGGSTQTRGRRGARGRNRGSRRGGRNGENGGDNRDDGNLRRFASADNINRSRGGRPQHRRNTQYDFQHLRSQGGHRGDGRRGEGSGRARGERRGTQSNRGGGRGDRGGGDRGRGRGDWRGPRRGEGRGVGERRHHPRRFSIEEYTACGDPDELTLRITSRIDQFKEFVDGDDVSAADSTTLLKVLGKAMTAEIHSESVQNIMLTVCGSRFLDSHIQTLILQLKENMEKGSIPVDKVLDTIEAIRLLISHISLTLPSYASKGSLLLTFINNQQSIVSAIRQHKPGLEEGLMVLQEDCDRCMAMLRDGKQHRERRKPATDEDDEIPPEGFDTLSIFPEGRDMDWSEKPFLRSNKAEGAFKDQNHYLDVQFRLLREDYIRPLREGIREYRRMREKGLHVKKNPDLRLYYGVKVKKLVFKDAIEHMVQFDISHLKRVRWQSSKRLLFGSLVCLSVDDFETMCFAVVTNRKIEDLGKGIIQIRIESGLNDVLDSSADDVFTMAETTAYFEAYRHVLEGLQLMKKKENFPLAPYIVECQKNVKPPRYVYRSGTISRMNMSSLLRKDSRFDASKVPVINPHSWPPLSDTTFDESQYESVQTALTKELAIIQGPPGTGKTYVGLKVAKVLLENKEVWNSPGESLPILVVCYTNHALDQFLEGILEFLPKGIVRVGSRCKNESLEEFNLKEIRARFRRDHSLSSSVNNNIKECYKALCKLRKELETVSTRLEATTKGIVGESKLMETMSDHHSISLKRGADAGGSGSVLMDWLTFGMASTEQEEENPEMYNQLVRKVTLQILQDSEADFDTTTVSATDILFLHPKVRAELYRSWVDSAKNLLEDWADDAMFTDASHTWKEAADSQILPDTILCPVVEESLYTAIRGGVLQQHQQHQQHQQSGSEDPSDYCIRAWLGIPCCPDLRTLQNTWDQLTEADKEAEKEDMLNVDEEADLVQSSRQLDDDDDTDLFYSSDQRSTYTLDEAMADLGVMDAGVMMRGQNAVSPDGWTVPVQMRKKQAKKIQHLLKSAKPMSKQEAQSVTNVWSTRLKTHDRLRLYLYWLRLYQRQLKDMVKDRVDEYGSLGRRMQELRFGEDREILGGATVIGMTTTGAARYRKVLASVACPIVMLEEAAEVLEAHVVTTLHKSCQHLILIGDHQQLRPSPTVYELCRHYQLDLSLFERLVNNKLPHSTLAVQHRMRPEVARLVRHIYPHLRDHDTTLNRPHIRGLKEDVFFLHHEVAEQCNDETSSKSNSHEAELCVGLCRYLLQQGYPPEKITILTAYSGQVLVIKSLFKKNPQYFGGVRLTAVDNFQGEENDLIILSLVRSNEQGSVGFLSTDNRVCVALSRARNGMYAFGNFRLLAEKSELWKNIAKTAKEHEQLGDALVLRCENHPDQEIRVSNAKDFDNAPEGGCKKPCNTRLACGHVCPRLCHIQDREHQQYRCLKKCERKTCDKGHPCTKKCHENCGSCLYKVEKTVPTCGHTAMMECSEDPQQFRCLSACEGKLPCGHQCTGKCGECRAKTTHVKCTEEVERMWPCGHMVKSQCHVTPGDLPCDTPCGAKLDCGHDCPGTCSQCLGGRVHVTCNKSCGKALPGCGHKCTLTCGTKCPPCRRKECGTACTHGSCNKPCGEPCQPCLQKCPWKCDHKTCDSVCSDPCEPCIMKCHKKLKCGHICIGFCGEKCFCYLCEQSNFVPLSMDGSVPAEPSSLRVDRRTKLIKLTRCGHIYRADVLGAYVEKKTQTLPPGASLKCPACQKLILDWDCWRYNSILRERQSSLQEAKKMLIESTKVSKARQDKIIKSMGLLTHNAEAEKSFASRSARQSLGDKGMDANKAFALTNQIKLTRVTETILKVLQDRPSKIAEQFSVKQKTLTLQKVLLKPMANMTDQRLKELTSETQRLAYMALFATAPLDDHKVQTYLQTLEDGRGQPAIDMAVLSSCQLNDSVWKCQVYDVLNLAIQKASSDQDIEHTAKTS